MTSPVHFISGLPRSGSTLLSAVLRQNPRFHAAMSSPVATLCFSVLPQMCAPAQFAPLFDDDRRRTMLRGVFSSYYARYREGADPCDVVFDTNRVWTGDTALLAELFPHARIICCVRELGWIIDSIERILRRNPLQLSRIFTPSQGSTLPSRVEALMDAEIGLIGAAWSNLRAAWFSDCADRLLVFSYEGFVRDPDGAMGRLYHALGEPGFAHNFNTITYDEPGFDADLGMPGLHQVASRIAPPERLPCIPPDIFNKYAASSFWRNPPERPRMPSIIC